MSSSSLPAARATDQWVSDKDVRKGQLLVKLGPYHAEPHEAEATPKANNVRTETPYPYLPPKVELVISPPIFGFVR